MYSDKNKTIVIFYMSFNSVLTWCFIQSNNEITSMRMRTTTRSNSYNYRHTDVKYSTFLHKAKVTYYIYMSDNYCWECLCSILIQYIWIFLLTSWSTFYINPKLYFTCWSWVSFYRRQSDWILVIDCPHTAGYV